MTTKISVKSVIWIVSLAATLFIGMAGIVYSSIDKRIDSKADRELVLQMQKEVHELWLLQIHRGGK